MPDKSRTSPFRFRGFISYSHLDARAAHRIHGALERYRIPSEISARLGIEGSKLGKFFIDRFDLAAGSLTDQIEDALRHSEHLIVVCSPNSRQSSHVEEEIRTFRALGRGKILALIVGGTTREGPDHCFPEALKWHSDAERAIPALRLPGMLAADMRPEADGEHLAKLKLVAGLLGIDLDEVRKRDSSAERRRRQLAMATAAVTTAFAVAAAWFAWQSSRQAAIAEANQRESIRIAADFADRVDDLTNNLKIADDKADRLLSVSQDSLKRLMPRTDPGEVRDFIDANLTFYDARMKRRAEDLDVWGPLTDRATEGFRKLAAASPNNPTYLRGLAKVAMQRGAYYNDKCKPEAALAAFSEAVAARELLNLMMPDFRSREEDRQHKLDLSTALIEQAKILRQQGRVPEARDAFERALSERRAIAELEHLSDRDSAILNLSYAMVELAELQGLAGDHEDQSRLLDQVVTLREDLITRNGNDMQYKRLLAWGYIFRGEALVRHGKPIAAIHMLEKALKLQDEVYQFSPSNPQREKDKAWAEGHLAEALLLSDRLPEAEGKFEQAVATMEKSLAKGNDRAIRHRQVAYWLVPYGKTMGRARRLDEARRALGRARDLMVIAAEADETNLQHKAELGLVYLELSRVERLAENLVEAEKLRQQALAQLAEVVAKAPDAARWRDWLTDVELDAPGLSPAHSSDPATSMPDVPVSRDQPARL